MDDQQKLQQMIHELNVYKSQADLLQQQIDALNASMAELEVLKSTINEMKDKDSVESLIPVGGGAFMEGEIKNTSNVVMSIGAGVAVKQTTEEAIETINSQEEELKDNLDKALKSLQKVSDYIGQLSPAAENLARALQAEGKLPQQ